MTLVVSCMERKGGNGFEQAAIASVIDCACLTLCFNLLATLAGSNFGSAEYKVVVSESLTAMVRTFPGRASIRSRPAENAFPLPERMTARILGSASIFWNREAACRISLVLSDVWRGQKGGGEILCGERIQGLRPIDFCQKVSN